MADAMAEGAGAARSHAGTRPGWVWVLPGGGLRITAVVPIAASAIGFPIAVAASRHRESTLADRGKDAAPARPGVGGRLD